MKANITRLGGYYYWNWKFPFRHFKKERLLITTENHIYEAILSKTFPKHQNIYIDDEIDIDNKYKWERFGNIIRLVKKEL